MSGHSKWATIRRKKGAIDAKRGAMFTKLIREITVAAREGGDDPESNARLRTVVLKAKASNMPSDNIDRAIKKGAGNLEGVIYEEVRYEGYGPGGVAIMIDCLTENRNRTTPEIKAIFTKNGFNLGESGSVSYLFDKKGYILIEKGSISEDELIEILLDYDVEDVKTENDGNISVTTSPEAYNDVTEFLMARGLSPVENEMSFIPKTTVSLDESKAEKCLKLIELFEDNDDTQNVYSNYDISDEIMIKISEKS